MNRLEEALTALSAAQVDRIRAVFASFTEGLLTSTEFVVMAVNIILTGNARGYALGASVARSTIERQTGQVEITPQVVRLHHLDEDRITQALETILDSDLDTAMQLVRLADNEPKAAATNGSHDVIKASESVTGWVRTIEVDACELCVWLRKEHLRPGGYIYPSTKPMHRHTGCMCEQTPVTTK